MAEGPAQTLPHRRSLWRFGHRTNRQCLRQRPERPPPGRPTHGGRDSSRLRCGGIASRLNKPKAYRGAEAAKAVWLALPDTRLLMTERPSSGAAGGGRMPALRIWLKARENPGTPRTAYVPCTFGAGVPESAEFCDGPGPGMALEQNSFLPPTTTGRGTWMTVIRRDHGELNITTNCITRSGQDVTSKNYPTKPHKADSKNSLRCEELYNYALCYVPDSWH